MITRDEETELVVGSGVDDVCVGLRGIRAVRFLRRIATRVRLGVRTRGVLGRA